ncbi:hypothetical protein CBL_08468 [Carabus blaptoides fortunei]
MKGTSLTTLSDVQMMIEEEQRGQDSEENRFELLKYLIKPEIVLNKYVTLWNLNVVTTMWDVIDKQGKKLIKVCIPGERWGSEILRCTTCIEQKAVQKGPPRLMGSRLRVFRPFQIISTDIVEPLPRSTVREIVCLPSVTYAVRTLIHEATGCTPFFINFDREHMLSGEDYPNTTTVPDEYDRDDVAERRVTDFARLYDVRKRLEQASKQSRTHYNL